MALGVSRGGDFDHFWRRTILLDPNSIVDLGIVDNPSSGRIVLCSINSHSIICNGVGLTGTDCLLGIDY